LNHINPIMFEKVTRITKPRLPLTILSEPAISYNLGLSKSNT